MDVPPSFHISIFKCDIIIASHQQGFFFLHMSSVSGHRIIPVLKARNLFLLPLPWICTNTFKFFFQKVLHLYSPVHFPWSLSNIRPSSFLKSDRMDMIAFLILIPFIQGCRFNFCKVQFWSCPTLFKNFPIKHGLQNKILSLLHGNKMFYHLVQLSQFFLITFFSAISATIVSSRPLTAKCICFQTLSPQHLKSLACPVIKS